MFVFLSFESSWRFIQYDMSELLKELGKLFGSFAMEDAEDPGDHLELDGFQFAFLRLFRRVEPMLAHVRRLQAGICYEAGYGQTQKFCLDWGHILF